MRGINARKAGGSAPALDDIEVSMSKEMDASLVKKMFDRLNPSLDKFGCGVKRQPIHVWAHVRRFQVLTLTLSIILTHPRLGHSPLFSGLGEREKIKKNKGGGGGGGKAPVHAAALGVQALRPNQIISAQTNSDQQRTRRQPAGWPAASRFQRSLKGARRAGVDEG